MEKSSEDSRTFSINCCRSNSNADLNVINTECSTLQSKNGLKYLPSWPAVNLQFQDLSYSVPDFTKGTKTLLRGIHGEFKSKQLTAILGPSGSGKTTLLNVLAGYYNTLSPNGQICVNNRPRQMKTFRRMSRYIRQNEVFAPYVTIQESMEMACHLKLGNELTKSQKMEVIDEIIDMLRLNPARHTNAHNLSGGEKKRFSIALELVNNPPLLFLDEPTTGLDEVASSVCIALLQRIAHSGRTIICSIHTPSAKIFDMFDKVYVLSDGQCAYQGSARNVVPFLRTVGLNCPITYNPADFIIEAVSDEYGTEFHEQMVAEVENGKCTTWLTNIYYSTVKNSRDSSKCIEEFHEEINPKLLKSKCSWIQQFRLLLQRMLFELWRNTYYLKLRIILIVALSLLIGCFYEGVGNDSTKSLFNFGFAFIIVMVSMYLHMMPVLLQFPTDIRLLKREYFNQWYDLSSYYMAMICSKIPVIVVFVSIFLTTVYLISNQPLEINRYGIIFLIMTLVAMISDSFGLLISSRFNIVNSVFVGPVACVPLILLSCFGVGFGKEIPTPGFIKFLMSMNYMRHGLEGIISALYGGNRGDTHCPDTHIFCMFKKSNYFLTVIGFHQINFVYSLFCLVCFYVVFTVLAFVLLKRRVSFKPSKYVAAQYISQFVKSHLNFSALKN